MSYTLTLRASLVSLLIHACPYIISGEEGENKTFLGIAFLEKNKLANNIAGFFLVPRSSKRQAGYLITDTHKLMW